MGAVYLSYKIRKAHKLDAQRFFNVLKKEVDSKNLFNEIKEHIRHGLCFKLQDEEGNILGLFLCMQYKSHYSLSYYYLDESVRRKPITLEFFLYCTTRLNPLYAMYVQKNKNYNSYSRYFTPTEDENILKFTGLRDSSLDDKFIEVYKWVE